MADIYKRRIGGGPIPGNAEHPPGARAPVPGDTAIGILASDEAARIIDGWRVDFDPNFYSLPPHLSLLYPIDMESGWWTENKNRIISAACGFVQFDVSFSSIGFFTDPVCVLWLRPDQGDTIRALKDAVEASTTGLTPDISREFIPHLTIGFFRDDAALHSALNRVQREFTPGNRNLLKFRVDKLYLMTIDDGYAWKIAEEIPLGCVSEEKNEDNFQKTC